MKRLASTAALLACAAFATAPTALAKPKDKPADEKPAKTDPTPGSAHSPWGPCDNFDPAVCLQPFPNNRFTRKGNTDTGLKVFFSPTSMPRNVAGKPIQPEQWNRNDGFSPGSLITTLVPGLDLHKSGAVPINDLARAFDKDAPIVVIDAQTLKRHPIWAEMETDSQAAEPLKEPRRNLILRPARNFLEGHTYIVALRNLKDKDGKAIAANSSFAAYRDGDTTSAGRRGQHMEWIFSKLESKKAGIKRKDLFLAWDFTVASQRNLSERMLHIRDDAFAQLGDNNLADMKIEGAPPTYTVTKVEDAPDGNQAVNTRAKVIQGTFDVPCYITSPACVPGGGFTYEPGTNKPMALPGNVYKSRFVCNIPWSAKDADNPGTPSLYGHGLFGSTGEIGQDQLKRFGNEHNFVFCATTWAGMGCELDIPSFSEDDITEAQAGHPNLPYNCDIPNVVTAIGDLSRFNTMIDRVQQGMLSFLYLGRLLAHPQGFAANDAFKLNGHSTITPGRTYYDGNSQGGIIGGSLAAIMVDGDRATLGVPGMNYSTLLQRSTDFGRGSDDECPPVQMPTPDDPEQLPSYACLVYKAYPAKEDRQVVFSLMQMLWDRGEADGYAQHMTDDPYPNTPAHEVILNLGFGDHQVTNWAAAVEARTIGAKLRTPALDTWRDPSTGYQYFGEIPAIEEYPYAGSAIVAWDSGWNPLTCKGTTAPMFEALPAFAGCPAGRQAEWGGSDPHELPRRTVANRAMKAAFLSEGGKVIDTCNGAPCHSDEHYDPPAP